MPLPPCGYHIPILARVQDSCLTHHHIWTIFCTAIRMVSGPSIADHGPTAIFGLSNKTSQEMQLPGSPTTHTYPLKHQELGPRPFLIRLTLLQMKAEWFRTLPASLEGASSQKNRRQKNTSSSLPNQRSSKNCCLDRN